MAAGKKAADSKAKAPASKKGKDGGRCWEGYEPTPGKKPGTKGSCKKKD